MKVLAVGDVNADLILPHRAPGWDEQSIVDDFQVHGGGCAANFALACARLGAESKLMGRVGGDQFGKLVLGELKKNGVNVRNVVISRGGHTGVTISLVTRAKRSLITYRGENAVFSIADINRDELEADLVHLPSFFLLEGLQTGYLKLIKSIKKSSTAIISFDTGWDPFGWRGNRIKILKRILRQVDVFLPNSNEARRILGRQTSEFDSVRLSEEFLKMGIKAIVLKEGDHGCFVSDGSKAARVPAFKTKVQDPTGAGDVFDAAFLLKYLGGMDIIRAGVFANAAAAISIGGVGWARYPTLGQVNNFLREHKPSQLTKDDSKKFKEQPHEL